MCQLTPSHTLSVHARDGVKGATGVHFCRALIRFFFVNTRTEKRFEVLNINTLKRQIAHSGVNFRRRACNAVFISEHRFLRGIFVGGGDSFVSRAYARPSRDRTSFRAICSTKLCAPLSQNERHLYVDLLVACCDG